MMLNTTESPLSAKSNYELFLISTFIFVLSALLLRFLMNLQTAILLKYYSISFTYSLFDISFTSVSATKWNPSMIYVVYGLGLLGFFVAGIMLLLIKVRNWKIKLILTWLAFLMIHTLPLGILAGILIFDGFGIAYAWLFPNIIVRVQIAIPVILITIYLRRFWMIRFLKTAYSSTYLENNATRKEFIRNCFILPWVAGTIILFAFALPHHTWIWLAYIFGLGLVTLPILRRAIPARKIIIKRSGNKILPFRYPLLYFITLLSTVWLLSLIRISL